MGRKRRKLAKSLVFTPFLTGSGSAALDRALTKTYVGQAHFAVGPDQCSSCLFHGYWQQFRGSSGDIVGTQERKTSCKKFFELTGQHGPGVPDHAWACRHYEKKREEG